MLVNEKSPHGGDVYTNKVRLDFSANINPAGMPSMATDALIKAAQNCSDYPDPYCAALREKIARYEGVAAGNVLCGNGAAELIYAFAYALPKDKKALVVSPTFCDYEAALTAAEIGTEHYVLSEKDGFRVTDALPNADIAKYCAVFLCSPNNPTGFTVDAGIVRALARTGVRLFLDLCFLDLTDEPNKYDVPALLRDFPNVAVLRAFTKSFAMAGVRLGYLLCADGAFLSAMSKKTQCWNVSTPAQAAGIAALDCGNWLRDSVKVIHRERENLAAGLRALGVYVYPGEANFLLLYSETDLYSELLKRGVLIRDCSNYVGLRKGFYRIAVRTPTENAALLSAVKEALS